MPGVATPKGKASPKPKAKADPSRPRTPSAGGKAEQTAQEKKVWETYQKCRDRMIKHHDPSKKEQVKICLYYHARGNCQNGDSCDKSHHADGKLKQDEKDACKVQLDKFEQINAEKEEKVSLYSTTEPGQQGRCSCLQVLQ